MPFSGSTILVIDDDNDARENLTRIFNELGYNVSACESKNAALQILQERYYDIIITDVIMETNKAGLDILKLVNIYSPSTKVIIITAHECNEDAFFSGEQNAFAYISKIEDDPYKKIKQKVKEALYFDAFISYKNDDKDQVRYLCNILKSNGLRIWVDYEQILPGQNFIEAIQRAIPFCKSSVVVFGEKGIGNWQKAELDASIKRAVENSIPFIPVLLPGVSSFPEKLIFLESRCHIKLNTCLNSGCELEKLIFGIFGDNKRIKRYLIR